MAEGDEADIGEGGLWGNEFLERPMCAAKEARGEGGLSFVDDMREVYTTDERGERGVFDVGGRRGDCGDEFDIVS